MSLGFAHRQKPARSPAQSNLWRISQEFAQQVMRTFGRKPKGDILSIGWKNSHKSSCVRFAELFLSPFMLASPHPPLAHPFFKSHLIPTLLLKEKGGKGEGKRRRRRRPTSSALQLPRKSFSNATLYLTMRR